MLLIVAVMTSLIALICGAAGWLAANMQSSALGTLSVDAGRVVTVEEVRSDLVAADAVATTGFLVGGLEPSSSREQYTTHVDNAARGLATLNFPTVAENTQVADVTTALASYTGLVEQARAANRQGLPVGSAYLDQASQLLRTDMLPALDALAESGANRAASSFDQVANARALLVVVVLGLVTLVGIHLWDSRRTHRVFNLGLTSAIVVLVVALVASWGMFTAASTATEVREGSYRTTLAVSQALAQGHEARAMESWTLIKRGSGAVYQEAFERAAEETSRRLTETIYLVDDIYQADNRSGPPLHVLFQTWVTEHEAIRALDDNGQWEEAVDLAKATGPDKPAALFDKFSTQASWVVTSAQDTTTNKLHDARQTASRVSWVYLATGLLVAWLSWWGLARRREEYR
jgi:hypothetical protein